MKYESLLKNNSYYPKSTGCSGPCCICEKYRRRQCLGYSKTIYDHEGNILYQFPLPIEYDYYDKDYLIEKNLGHKYNSEDLLEDFFKTMEEKEYIKKSEVFKLLESEYNLKLSERNLRFYVVKGIISPPIVDRVPGLSGSVSLYKKSTPAIIFLVKWLQKSKGRYSLEKIVELFKLLEFEDETEILRLADPKDIEARIDRLKLISMAYFKALAELDLFNKINMMTSKEVKEHSFGKVRKGKDIVDGPGLLLDLLHSNVEKDYIFITLAKPIGKVIIFDRKGMTVS